MPCDTKLKQGQTIAQRKEEVRAAVQRFNQGLLSGKITARVGAQGGIAFDGISEEDRDAVTDACAYRRLMVAGSSLAKAAIARAEQIAGRSVNRQAIGQGLHSHDGGKSWHQGH